MKRSLVYPPLVEKKSDERNVRELVNAIRSNADTWLQQVRVRGKTIGDGNYVSLWTDTIDVGSFYLRAVVLGRGTTSGAWYEIQEGLQNFAGTVSVIGGSAAIVTREDAGAMDAKFTVTGTSVSLQVRDDAAQAMAWTAILNVTSAG